VGLLFWKLAARAGMRSSLTGADTADAETTRSMLPSTHEWLMTLRPMSQLVRMFVVPEIERRVATGALTENDLPFQLVQFRWIQADGNNIIELNEEVKLRAKIKTRRPGVESANARSEEPPIAARGTLRPDGPATLESLSASARFRRSA
jgi:hypothetical protein